MFLHSGKDWAFLKATSVAEFMVPDWGDKVDYGIGFSYRTAMPMQPGGLVRQPYAGVNFIPPVRDYELGYTGQDLLSANGSVRIFLTNAMIVDCSSFEESKIFQLSMIVNKCKNFIFFKLI